MGKVVGGLKKVAPAAGVISEVSPAAQAAEALSKDTSNRTMAEELAAKKTARTRGGSRMLLSDARVNAQEGLSATSTLG
jgi:hypothetical protein